MRRIPKLIVPLLLVIPLLLALSSCKNGPGHTAVRVPDGNTFILVGTTGFPVLKEVPFSDWFTPAYNGFAPEAEKIEALGPLLEEVRILAFLGTWCEDSHREIPKFVKILEAAEYPVQEISVVAMTRDKTTPDAYEAGLEITNIPTLIFYRDGEELGRIVEFPVEDLESDMLKILRGEPYKHVYDWD